ncbi:MAG: O-linked GlcNAc transferase, partial [Solibacillus sp.]
MSKIENLFYNGQFLACYEAVKQNKVAQEDQMAKKLIQLFAQYEYEKFPIMTQKIVQSVERSNESYEEFDEVEEIR